MAQSETQKERVRQTDWWDVRRLALAADGHALAAGVRNRVLLFDADSPTQLKEMGKPGGDMVTHLAFSPDSGLLASANWDGRVRLWNLDHPHEKIQPLKAHSGQAWAVAFSPDGRTLATGGDDATIKLWNLASLQQTATLRGHTGPVNRLVFSRDGALLASCSGDGTARLWRAPTFQEIERAEKASQTQKLDP